MKISKVLCIISLCTHFQIINSQNLLDTSTWTIGSGNVGGFYSNGSAAENIREYGLNHIGENVILWKAVPDASNNSDGGWNSTYKTIDNTKKYRLSVWIKKTNSNTGITYFGCQQWNYEKVTGIYNILYLNGTIRDNPYFWSGDLPKLDRWYLLVGFVHEKNSSVTANQGGIYDGITGELVQNITDYKFDALTNKLRHRAYLYYDTNTSDRQYFYAPRIELVNGGEYTLNQLLSLNPNSELQFAYDDSGNQKQRFYCPDSSCPTPTPPAGKSTTKKNSIVEETKIEAEEQINFDDQLKIYPNPTQDVVYVKIQPELLAKTESVKIYNTNSSLIKTLKINNPRHNLEVDLAGKPSGVYFLHIHLNDGSPSITKKIIKN